MIRRRAVVFMALAIPLLASCAPQRWFEAAAITRPSWASTGRPPVWRWRSRLSRFIRRNTRLWFRAGSPVARRVRFRIAVTRR